MRRKSFYIHEESILQQYVLNELLSRGSYIQYEKFVPAVRYLEREKTYVTGYGIQEEVVSFAYQIDMSAVNGEKEIKNGMFRPFYDCWTEYIQYVQEGIERLNGETVYRVKLDIKGFYDNIRKNVVRDALYPPIRQALLKDETKFRCFRRVDDEEDDCAIRLVDWILNELFKKECYSAETGKVYIREDSDCGIPQGPNLSAYVANIVLFELDQKILQIIQQINSGCDSEHIAARYCRYVDDMIIITSESENLLKIKNAIAAILYEMGLELSHKTDAEDGVTKEEAIEWTVDARGGLGVSVGYDMADDTLESVMDECNEYDVVDRRTALKLIRSTLQPLLYGDITEEDLQKKDAGQALLDAIFRVEEIRANDIIRFSEFLIYRAAEKMGEIFEEYKEAWKCGMEMCPNESVLWMEGIDVFVFLEGCLKILQRKKEIEKKNIYSIWHTAVEKIRHIFKKSNNFLKKLHSEAMHSELLKKNAWIIRLKYLQICSLLGEEVDFHKDEENLTDNEYSERWIWLLTDKELWNISKTTSILQTFHFVIMTYQNADKKEEIENVNSEIKNYKEELLNSSERNILTDCMRIWIKKDKIVSYSEDTIKIALRVLLNSLRYGIRAEVVRGIPLFSDYLFENRDNLQILPVFPGVDYPGIIAYAAVDGKVTAERFDFQKSVIRTGNQEIWNKDNEKKILNSDLTYYTAELREEKKEYISLEEYFSEEIGELSSVDCQKGTIEKILKKIIRVYPILAQKIKEIYYKYPEDRILLSKKNLILCIDKEKKISLELGMSYLVSAQKISGAVAVEKDSKYILEHVNESGAPYWIAGRILADTIHLDQINLKLEEGNRDLHDCVEMLRYSFRRLQGHYLNFRGTTKRTKHSFEKTMHRTIGNMKSFLEQCEGRKLYLESAKIENDFIAFRLNKSDYTFEDISLELAVWAKNSLRRSYRQILPIVMDSIGGINDQYDIVRRVPRWYCYLADRLLKIISNDISSFMAVRLLSASLFSDAVLLNLRMQTLERIMALSKKERRILSEQINVPYAELGIEDNCVLITGRNKERKWIRLWKNLLNLKLDVNIRSVTHMGWITMISKLYEVDKTVGFVVKENADIKSKSVELLKKMILKLGLSTSERVRSEAFPYEGVENFYDIWNPESVQEMINIMNELDALSGIVVKKQESETYSQKVREADVIIDCEDDHLTENKYFLTFSKIGSGIFELEKDLDDPQKIVYSISMKRDRKLGVSTIISDFGQLLQRWESTSTLVLTKEKKRDAKNREKTCKFEHSSENNDLKDSNENLKTTGWKNGICKEQKKLWEKRRKKFLNYDRIAIFQFNIDNTYYPPSMEKCTGFNVDESNKMVKSCAEFRRRKILEQVFEACNLFDVEILLLPEYSVRPETVEWMAQIIEDEKYKFAVWAGTFRIPVDHKFAQDSYWKDASDLNKKDHFHAAVLPVIVPGNSIGQDKTTILTNKTKKYPSVALHEEINPIPAAQENFKPVMRKRFEDRYDKNILFGNAWDDVTEVICAEMFALSAVCNYPSFLIESYKAYEKYQTAKTMMSQDDYEKEMFKDIKTYGQYTSIYQLERRNGRTPVVLVPACTTRATDYYVWGQGQYLAAGIKTVLCNSAGKAARGGSCFIGQDSWDDRKIEHDEKLLENTVYHGLKPGMYRQSSHNADRGALGQLEQALLIYDVNPQYEKSNPTAESMLDSLSIVAHIPIIEIRVKKDSCEKCRNSYICQVRKNESISEKDICARVYKLIDFFQKTVQSTNTMALKDIEKTGNIAVLLEEIGRFCNSEWLCRRGDFFRKYFISRPEKWIAPTVLDWIYIEINYDEFLESEDEYLIQVTE